MNKENTLTRDQIQERYIRDFVHNCELEDLQRIVFTQMKDDLDMLDDKELVKEVKYYAPELIEGITLSVWKKKTTRIS